MECTSSGNLKFEFGEESIFSTTGKPIYRFGKLRKTNLYDNEIAIIRSGNKRLDSACGLDS